MSRVTFRSQQHFGQACDETVLFFEPYGQDGAYMPAPQALIMPALGSVDVTEVPLLIEERRSMKYTVQTVAETPKEKSFTFLKCEWSHMHELTDLHIYSVSTNKCRHRSFQHQLIFDIAGWK